MALVLAIESNSGQADTLRHLLRTRPDIDVVVVGSTEAAVAAIAKRVPDLVLLDALLSPRDEDSFIAHLRTLPGAGHLQTLTIPQLRPTSNDARGLTSIFGKWKRRRAGEGSGGCDPTQFGDEVATYLSRACEVKAEIEQRTAAVPRGQVVADGQPAQTLTTALAPVRASTEPTRATAEEHRHADIVRLETEAAESREAAVRDAQLAAEAQAGATLAAELDQVRADAERTQAAELAAAEERHGADIARLETEAAEKRDAAARDARLAAEVQADATLAAELDQVRAEAERTLAAELAAAEERIARLETETAEKRDAAARDAQLAAEAQAGATLAAELDQVRADAERAQAAELAAAEERHGADIARLETEAAEKRDAAARDARLAAEVQADATLAAELDQVRAEAERTLAAELAAAEERIARLETETAEKRDAAARDAQLAAEAQAGATLAAELDQVRADAERTQAAELAAAEERHGADIARLETEAAEKRDAAARDAQLAAEVQADAQLAAEAQAGATLAAELDQVRADAERTQAAELAAAEERHGADIARLETEAAERSEAAVRDAQAAAETQAAQTSTAELDRIRAEAERTLAAELAAAEERHGADIARLETEAAERSEAAVRDAQAGAAESEVSAAASSTSVPHPPSPESVDGDEEEDASRATDYYGLWRARVAAAEAPPAEVSVARPSRIDPRRRRWALSVAATLLILLTSNLESGSTPRHARAVDAAIESHATASTRPLDQDDARMAPTPGAMGRPDSWEPAEEDNPRTGLSGRAPFEQLALEAMCVLAVMLLLRVALFVGEGFVWHGLVAALGLMLLGFAVLRAPWGG